MTFKENLFEEIYNNFYTNCLSKKDICWYFFEAGFDNGEKFTKYKYNFNAEHNNKIEKEYLKENGYEEIKE